MTQLVAEKYWNVIWIVKLMQIFLEIAEKYQNGKITKIWLKTW